MRILSIFCDMVRPEFLNLYFGKEKTVLDKELEQIGGTIYTNCITPSPDSGRSLACYWTGRNPDGNGCNKRIKYPKFYLRRSSFLDILNQKDYAFNFFINPNERILGVLPPSYDETGFHNEDLNLYKFLSQIKIPHNSYTHISLTDFHWTLDDYGANKKGVANGLRVLSDSIRTIRNRLDFSLFDLVIVFSDHGCKLKEEFEKQPKHLLLNSDRTNIMMQLNVKHQKGISTNNKLCSIVDVYPTIMALMEETNVDNELDGYSLLSDLAHPYIVAEDHYSFRPEINQNLNVWAVIKSKGRYYRELDGYHFEMEEAFTESPQELDDLIVQNSSYFQEAVKDYYILTLYKNMTTIKNTYTNGEPRYFPLWVKLWFLIKTLIKRKRRQ